MPKVYGKSHAFAEKSLEKVCGLLNHPHDDLDADKILSSRRKNFSTEAYNILRQPYLLNLALKDIAFLGFLLLVSFIRILGFVIIL